MSEETMPSVHPNVSRVLEGMQAFNAGDLDGVRSVYRDDLIYHVSGRGSLAGEYHGIEAYAAVVNRVRDETGGTMQFDMDVILADDRTVMMLTRSRGERLGRRLESESVYVFLFDSNGLCYEGRTIPVDQYAYDAFWS